MNLLPMPDRDHPVNTHAFAGWHAAGHPVALALVGLLALSSMGDSIARLAAPTPASGLSWLRDWAGWARLVSAGAVSAWLIGSFLWHSVLIGIRGRCAGCLGAREAGALACPTCGTEWASGAERTARDTSDAIWGHALGHGVRDRVVLTLFGAGALLAILNASVAIGQGSAGGLGALALRAASDLSFHGAMIAFGVITIRTAARVRRERLCPRCLYAMGEDEARCHECGRARTLPAS